MPIVAIAGSGDLSRYFCEEFTKAGHNVIVLTRSVKSHLNDIPKVEQRITDYSVQSLRREIGESQALISAILDYSMGNIDVHLNLIEACKLSAQCKRFIPSEYAGNLEDYPDQPAFYYPNHEPIREALRQQNELEWTLPSVGWLIDYIFPIGNRYLKDIGEAFPINLADNKIVIPGTGTEPINVTAARDVAKALAALFYAPSWEPYTYIAGEETTWNQVAATIKQRYPDIQVSSKSLTQLVKDVCNAKDDDSRMVAEFQIFSVSRATSFDPVKVQAQRQKYFQGIHFRTIQELLKQYDGNKNMIL